MEVRREDVFLCVTLRNNFFAKVRKGPQRFAEKRHHLKNFAKQLFTSLSKVRSLNFSNLNLFIRSDF